MILEHDNKTGGSAPEASRLRVVVIVEVGDDAGESNDARLVGVLVGSSGDAERCFRLDADSPAEATQMLRGTITELWSSNEPR